MAIYCVGFCMVGRHQFSYILTIIGDGKMATRKKNEVTENVVSSDELVKAATNTPDKNTIKIGDKEFLLKDFKYKDYIAFIKYLAPMFDLFLGAQRLNTGNSLNALSIIEFCDDDLPKMGLMIARNTYPDMTEDELLEVTPSPFEMADLVLAQIAHNRIIERLTGFLQLMTPQKRA
jgi:hypothetical protein